MGKLTVLSFMKVTNLFDFLIINKLSHSIILGNQELDARRANIHYPTATLSLDPDKGKTVILPISFFKNAEDVAPTKTYEVAAMEDISVPGKSHIVVFAKIKYRLPDSSHEQPQFQQGTQILVQASHMQHNDKNFLWIPRTIVSTTDQDEIPILLLNLSNAPQTINQKQVLTHAQLITDCVTNVIELSGNSMEFEPSLTSNFVFEFPSVTNLELANPNEITNSGRILNPCPLVDSENSHPVGEWCLCCSNDTPHISQNTISNSIANQHQQELKNCNIQNIPVAESNLRVDDDGWLFLHGPDQTKITQFNNQKAMNSSKRILCVKLILNFLNYKNSKLLN